MKGNSCRVLPANICNRLENWIFCCVLIFIMIYFNYYNIHPEIPPNMVLVPISDIMTGEPVQLPQDDHRIIDFIWTNKLLEAPSTGDYNLTDPNVNPSTGQGQFIETLFKNMTNGFFVECGAYDGETYSNTLFLEMKLGWKGLLVEGGPRNYPDLKRRNRKAWTSNTCLAIKPYPHRVRFRENYALGKISHNGKGPEVQCVPLFSLLAALNVTTVDYFSLDVEGHELQVLKTIPFDRIFIKSLTVEFFHTIEGKKPLRDFMESKGFKMVKEHRHNPKEVETDFVFVHRNVLNNMSN